MDPHLLIVDDDERIRSLLQQFLIQSDYLVSTAEDAEQARTLLSAIEFDLIILDVMMPGQDVFHLPLNLENYKIKHQFYCLQLEEKLRIE